MCEWHVIAIKMETCGNIAASRQRNVNQNASETRNVAHHSHVTHATKSNVCVWGPFVVGLVSLSLSGRLSPALAKCCVLEWRSNTEHAILCSHRQSGSRVSPRAMSGCVPPAEWEAAAAICAGECARPRAPAHVHTLGQRARARTCDTQAKISTFFTGSDERHRWLSFDDSTTNASTTTSKCSLFNTLAHFAAALTCDSRVCVHSHAIGTHTHTAMEPTVDVCANVNKTFLSSSICYFCRP